MNTAQIGALQRVGVMITNIRAGGYKFNMLLRRPDVTVAGLKEFGEPYARGIDEVGASAIRWLEAAINDKDYPELPEGSSGSGTSATPS